jgi:DNA-binding NarL/FixJ family response regulator
VLDLAAKGLSNADIAAQLVTSVSTVRKHMEHIFDRVGVRTRGAAVARLLPEIRRIDRHDEMT